MEKRTEDDIVSQAGIEVMLGGKSYEIAPLVIKDSRVWRKKVIGLIAPLPEMVGTVSNTENTEAFEDVLTKLMVTMPDQVLDLFFDYAKALDRDEIENIATDTEMAKAFEEIVKVAFPLVSSLPKVMSHISQ